MLIKFGCIPGADGQTLQFLSSSNDLKLSTSSVYAVRPSRAIPPGQKAVRKPGRRWASSRKMPNFHK